MWGGDPKTLLKHIYNNFLIILTRILYYIWKTSTSGTSHSKMDSNQVFKTSEFIFIEYASVIILCAECNPPHPTHKLSE